MPGRNCICNDSKLILVNKFWTDSSLLENVNDSDKLLLW